MSSQSESLEERLTRHFYEWEMWGRGWQVWSEPVHLEPPFHPFFGHFSSSEVVTDDGRKPTFLSGLTERFIRILKRSASQEQGSENRSPETERTPYLFEESGELAELQIALPAGAKVAKDASEQFVLSLGHLSRPLSFELIGTSKNVTIQLACGERDCSRVRGQMQAWFPEALVLDRSSYLQSLWSIGGQRETAIVDAGLCNEFMRPIRRFERFDPDPLAGIVGSMDDLLETDIALFQVLFVPVLNAWPESILRAVTDGQGGSFFLDDREMVPLAGQKISSPLFAVAVRAAAQSATDERAWEIAERITNSLRQMGDPRSNRLIPLSNEDYDDTVHSEDVLLRQSRRCGMLLNSDELLSFAHLPSASVRSEKLKREDRKTRAAPSLALGHRLCLGHNEHAGKSAPVTLSPDQRVRHTYVIGASGTGKSTLLLRMIMQDLENGDGLAVLDPHGDLIDSIVAHIPENRVKDVVLVDPSDEHYPVGFNILSAHSELERNLLSSDLVAAFQRLSTSWGDQMTSVLGNAILAFLESSDGGTLVDLRRFLVEPGFRNQFLETVRDPEVVYYWRKEFPLLAGRPQAPILTRLDTFLRPKLIRHMVSQRSDKLDFPAIMNGRKILLGKLAQGLIGEENSYLLGTLLVSRLNQAAMSRQEVAASARPHFYLYIDEFHNFVTPSLAAILAGARKYNLGLVLAHQESQQLQSRSRDIASAVLSNPYTRVCFRLGDFDAKKLEEGFSHFGAKDLLNLGVGEAICRIERAEYDFNLRIEPVAGPDPAVEEQRRAAVVASSRGRNATRREEVARPHDEDRPVAPPAEPTRETKAQGASDAPAPKAKKQAEEKTASPGRGGQQHKYLQTLIKTWGEQRGYQVVIEKPILNGLGSVDVALEKEKVCIACEISVTTSAEHEVANIQKCLAAGFSYVFAVSSEKKTLDRVRAATMPTLSDGQRKQVQFLTTEQVFTFLENLEVKPSAPAPLHGSKELLTAKELEELLRIDAKTIYSYAQRGLIPYVRIQSNLRFVKSEVMAWLAERQFRPRVRSKLR